MKLFFSWKRFSETTTSLKNTVRDFVFEKHFHKGSNFYQRGIVRQRNVLWASRVLCCSSTSLRILAVLIMIIELVDKENKGKRFFTFWNLIGHRYRGLISNVKTRHWKETILIIQKNLSGYQCFYQKNRKKQFDIGTQLHRDSENREGLASGWHLIISTIWQTFFTKPGQNFFDCLCIYRRVM